MNQRTKKGVSYIPSLDAVTNNAHALVPAVRSLIVAFTSMGARKAAHAMGVGQATAHSMATASIHRAFKATASACSRVLLGMKSEEMSKEFKHFPLPAMTLLLDRFAHGCTVMDRGSLESVFPYALVHTSHTGELVSCLVG